MMTDAEQKLWRYLRMVPRDDAHFRRQATIGPYFADFACHGTRLVIEVDGGQHGESRGAVGDAKRTTFLEARGYRVLRFWNNEVLSNIEGVMQAINAALERGDVTFPPPPTPPRRKGGGRGAEAPLHADKSVERRRT
jgi:very-short-patch-repair endonuclease